ncbi:DNA repair protein RecO [Marinicrinis lubricantis]|uniref:DNA repair protein RecO n=1 Tax=Marinicrinis lubricantis TaxID=2086470 RepID=A0ABW1IVG0_9BACL
MLQRAEGVVIKSFDYGEGNKIVKLLTETGKVTVMAKGAKKVKSRHSAVVQMFTHADFVFYKSGDMGTLNHGETIQSFHALRTDLYKSAYAAYLAEITDRLMEEQEGSSAIFHQLIAGFEALEADKDPVIVMQTYELKMLHLAGYAPIFDTCVSCGAKERLSYFSPGMGGALCTDCQTQDTYRMPVDDKARKLLYMLQRLDLKRLGETNVSDGTKQQTQQLLRRFMDTHIHIKWKARSFLDQMKEYGI